MMVVGDVAGNNMQTRCLRDTKLIKNTMNTRLRAIAEIEYWFYSSFILEGILEESCHHRS